MPERRERWICDTCGKSWATEQEAEECEKRHQEKPPRWIGGNQQIKVRLES